MTNLISTTTLTLSLSLALLSTSNAQAENHLFILSGQSNMQGLRPDESFLPTVIEKFGKDNVTVVFDALGGQPIRRWYKGWKPSSGEGPKATGDLYDRLMKKVQEGSAGKKFSSVTLIWMQGERDAKEEHGDVYAASLQGLIDQLSADLGRDDVNFVIGRLSDFDMENKRYKDWTKIRKVQVEFADSHDFTTWVNTDDLNDGKNRRGKDISNDLHYSGEGYRLLGERFADGAIKLIEARLKSEKR